MGIRAQYWEKDEKGELGLVAATIRGALDTSAGYGLHRIVENSRDRRNIPALKAGMMREAREWLDSTHFDLWCHAANADPDTIRAGIMQRCPWLKEG